MKVFIGYVSLSGNTEKMAINIKNRMMAVGCEVYMERLDTVEVDTLKDFDLAFIGLYTWNQDDLPYEAHEFYEELDQADFPGGKVAFFGAGDAIHILSAKMKICGFTVYDRVLKMEQETPAHDQCEDFADQALSWGSKRMKWRFILTNLMQNNPKYQRPPIC
ncbi:flavodoxin domain-containing protein [Peribacillus muralis]|uniref:flavodoxin domain-containing protein n=1 Tax=Peribacillus muralis TaxID=264697 RepID=UPI0036717AC8